MKLAEIGLIFALIVISVLAVFLMVPGSTLAAAEIVTLRLMQLAVLLIAFFATVYCLRGTKYDVLEEIFERENVAAALVISALLIALSGVIGK